MQEKDNNPCSPSYNQNHWINGGNACTTSPNWVGNGTTNCNNCVNKTVEEDNNVCSPTYTQTRWVSGGNACDMVANWQTTGDASCNDNVSQIQEKDNNVCSQTYTQTRWVNGGNACVLGIEEVNNTTISIYPNPTSNDFTVEINGEATITIKDVLGRLIQQNDIFNKQTIYTSEWAKGIYYVYISTNKKTYTRKIYVID